MTRVMDLKSEGMTYRVFDKLGQREIEERVNETDFNTPPAAPQQAASTAWARRQKSAASSARTSSFLNLADHRRFR